MESHATKLKRASEERLGLLIGESCWGVLAGVPNGQVIYLNFGEKIEEEVPVHNPDLPYDLGKYQGEYVLGVYCNWRLQAKGRPITGCCEPNDLDGILVRSIRELVGESVSGIEVMDECGDIAIQFGEKTLKVFSVYTGNEDEDYLPQWEINWYLSYRGNHIVTVTRGCEIVLRD